MSNYNQTKIGTVAIVLGVIGALILVGLCVVALILQVNGV